MGKPVIMQPVGSDIKHTCQTYLKVRKKSCVAQGKPILLHVRHNEYTYCH